MNGKPGGPPNAHGHRQDVDRLREGMWRYYCSCGWSTKWRDPYSPEWDVDRQAAHAHFESTEAGPRGRR